MPSTYTELPIPDFYDPANAADWAYAVDQEAIYQAATAWRARFELVPSSQVRPRVHLLLVDLQKDFCYPAGSLYVGGRSGRGAIEDNDRIARFIYRNLAVVSQITCTMDTHYPHQIFSPAFWLDAEGNPPAPHQEITADEIEQGRFRPSPGLAGWLANGDYDWLVRHTIHYCHELARTGKYTLYLWPPHCLIGSPGYDLAGVIHEARLFHAWARLAEAAIEVKGDTRLTEFYSALGPEVTTSFDGTPVGERNHHFVETLMQSDALVIAGQAASHCVRATIEDLLTTIEPELARKVYILSDCASAVAVPHPERPGDFVFDFTPQAEQALKRFADAGMHVVESTRPLDQWPDFPK